MSLMLKLNTEIIITSVFVILCSILLFSADASEWTDLSSPEVIGEWVRPAGDKPSRPVWGHADGLRIGLHPMSGPRGLIRIYTPYLAHAPDRMINYLAVEPVPEGEIHRGYSELEWSSLDNVQGKRMWSGNSPEDNSLRDNDIPASGVISTEGGVETLTVYIFVERFHNGAHVYLRIRFHEDCPKEVEVATFTRDDSKPLKYCIITATMGNWARLRKLHLKDSIITSHELWPEYKDDGFTPHASFSLEDMIRNEDGDVIFMASPDEANPVDVEYSKDTPPWWKYHGKTATQYWRVKNPNDDLAGQVNGRYTYWGTRSPIPGGIAFENFEMVVNFQNGETLIFGVK